MLAQILVRALVLLALAGAATAQVTTTTQPVDADAVLSATVEYVLILGAFAGTMFVHVLTKEKGKVKQ